MDTTEDNTNPIFKISIAESLLNEFYREESIFKALNLLSEILTENETTSNYRHILSIILNKTLECFSKSDNRTRSALIHLISLHQDKFIDNLYIQKDIVKYIFDIIIGCDSIGRAYSIQLLINLPTLVEKKLELLHLILNLLLKDDALLEEKMLILQLLNKLLVRKGLICGKYIIDFAILNFHKIINMRMKCCTKLASPCENCENFTWKMLKFMKNHSKLFTERYEIIEKRTQISFLQILQNFTRDYKLLYSNENECSRNRILSLILLIIKQIGLDIPNFVKLSFDQFNMTTLNSFLYMLNFIHFEQNLHLTAFLLENSRNILSIYNPLKYKIHSHCMIFHVLALVIDSTSVEMEESKMSLGALCKILYNVILFQKSLTGIGSHLVKFIAYYTNPENISAKDSTFFGKYNNVYHVTQILLQTKSQFEFHEQIKIALIRNFTHILLSESVSNEEISNYLRFLKNISKYRHAILIDNFIEILSSLMSNESLSENIPQELRNKILKYLITIQAFPTSMQYSSNLDERYSIFAFAFACDMPVASQQLKTFIESDYISTQVKEYLTQSFLYKERILNYLNDECGLLNMKYAEDIAEENEKMKEFQLNFLSQNIEEYQLGVSPFVREVISSPFKIIFSLVSLLDNFSSDCSVLVQELFNSLCSIFLVKEKVLCDIIGLKSYLLQIKNNNNNNNNTSTTHSCPLELKQRIKKIIELFSQYSLILYIPLDIQIQTHVELDSTCSAHIIRIEICLKHNIPPMTIQCKCLVNLKLTRKFEFKITCKSNQKIKNEIFTIKYPQNAKEKGKYVDIAFCFSFLYEDFYQVNFYNYTEKLILI